MTYRQKYHVFDTMFCVWILHKYRPNSTYLGPHKYSVQRVTTKFMELDASQKTAATKCKGINANLVPTPQTLLGRRERALGTRLK